MGSKKDWEDDYDEVDSIYKFPYPENIEVAKCDPSEPLNIFARTPLKAHESITKSRKTYSRLANNLFGLGEKETLLFDTQFKKKSNCKKPKNVKKLPKKIEPVVQSDLKVEPVIPSDLKVEHVVQSDPKVAETDDLFIRSSSNGKCAKLKSGKIYHRTMKNRKRKLEEEKASSTDKSNDTLQVPIQNTIDSKVHDDLVNMEENSEESSTDLHLDFQPPPPAQKLSLMDLVQKYSESIDPSQPEEIKNPIKNPVKRVKQGKKVCTALIEHSITKTPLNDQKSNKAESNKKLPEAAKSSLISAPCQKKSKALVKKEGISNSISSKEKISHMNMRESLIKFCKGKISNLKDSTMLSTEDKNLNFKFINSKFNNSLNGENVHSKSAKSGLDCGSSSTVVERTTVSVESIISQEESYLKSDFQIQHRTSYLQSADYICNYTGEINAKKKGRGSDFEEDYFVKDITVREFCSTPYVNDAFSEIASGCTDVGDPSSPNICYKFPDDFLDKPFQSVLSNYVRWLVNIMITCDNNNNNSYFGSKYILDFSYKHMSYQECAIMSMLFSDPKEHLELSSIVAKLHLVGMVIMFNAYLKETCKPH